MLRQLFQHGICFHLLLNQVAQLEQRSLENEQALLQLRRQNLLQGEALPLLHSLCGHTPSLPASSAAGKQLWGAEAVGRLYQTPWRFTETPYNISLWSFPASTQSTGFSKARICSKISVEVEHGTAMRSAPKPGRIWPSAFSYRNARAGFTVTIWKIFSAETLGNSF